MTEIQNTFQNIFYYNKTYIQQQTKDKLILNKTALEVKFNLNVVIIS